jgi:hypothetical protein
MLVPQAVGMNLVWNADVYGPLQAQMPVCRGNKECCVLLAETHSTAGYTIKMSTVSFLYLKKKNCNVFFFLNLFCIHFSPV